MNLYLCDIRQTDVEQEFDRLLSVVDDDRRDSILRYKMIGDRKRAIVREVMLTAILFDHYGDSCIELGRNAHGRPYISKVSDVSGKERALEAAFDFNISHSGDIVVIAFGTGPVGVDVERIGRAKDYKKLLRFYSKEERDYVSDSVDPQDTFYRVWTMREALSKQEGSGLMLFEKESVHIDLDRQQVRLHEKDLQLYEYDYPGYHICLCAGSQDERPDMELIGERGWQRIKEVFCAGHIKIVTGDKGGQNDQGVAYN
ncbi:MAG: 4'-phosphopantetheinyl transferase superfamily protein [Lachnospiraceae bacterium]|nr:4'-phosphopantetheinyl transferase superfamily protein [Lachnospiraceae bacterium]